MTSLVNKNVKLETKIEIPEDYIGLVYYHDYYQFTLPSGNHSLHKDSFYKIIKKNERKNRNSKKPKFNFNIHYINQKNLNIELSFKRKNSHRIKNNYTLLMEYKISNELKFAREILSTCYYTTSQRTTNIVHDWFRQFSKYIFRKKVENSPDKTKTLADKYFSHFGITVLDINLNGEYKQSFYSTIPQTSNIETFDNLTNNSQPKQATQNYIGFNTPIDNSKFCPNCQSKLLENSAYCLKCGKKIN